MNLNEIWRDIPDYPNYQISNLGNVRNIKTGRILKPRMTKGGYLQVHFEMNGRNYYIHRLVAESFLPNPSNYPEVNHIDENKTNNSVDNLEWCTTQYNCEYSRAKQIAQYDLNGNLIKVWKSAAEISRQLGFDSSCISRACNGYLNSSYNFIWKYL